MTDPKAKETQQELFEQFSGASKKPERFPALSRTQKPLLVTTNMEQLLMGAILLILVLCGVFFLGVLRGKSLARPAPLSVRAAAAPVSRIDAAQPRSAAPATNAPAVITPPEPIRPSGAAVSAKPYTIQLVTHRKKEFAETEMKTLQNAGFISTIIPSGEYFQVCAGQYASKEEARKDLARFSAKYKDCFLRRR